VTPYLQTHHLGGILGGHGSKTPTAGTLGRGDERRSTSELEGSNRQNQSTWHNVIIKIEQHPNAVLY
jgi:hypothetical protein